MVFAQVLGVEQFQQRVRIYATDVDTEALNQARLGTYSSEQVMKIPPTLLSQYFEQAGNRYVFRSDLRRSVIFSCHNLIADAPMSKIDLLLCRNVLMYLNPEGQNRVLVRFHFSLKDTGFLFLGKTEMVSTYIQLFTAVNRQQILTKIPRAIDNYLLYTAFGRNATDSRRTN